MGYLLYLMFRCDRRCDGKFGNLVGTKHTQGCLVLLTAKVLTKVALELVEQSFHISLLSFVLKQKKGLTINLICLNKLNLLSLPPDITRSLVSTCRKHKFLPKKLTAKASRDD